MDKKAADDTLKTVFAACNQQPNETDMNSLVENKEEYSRKYKHSFIIAIAAFILFFFSPLAFAPFSGTFAPDEFDPAPAANGAAITIEHHELTEDQFILVVSGELVDFTSAYAVNPEGIRIYPVSYSSMTGEIIFPYDNTEWNIYISDYNGEQLHLLLSPKE